MEQNSQFFNYITSMGYQALIFLGAIEDPNTNQTRKNLKHARLLIDTLTMIQEKTQGNLSSEEENLLTTYVYELQQKYDTIIKEEDI